MRTLFHNALIWAALALIVFSLSSRSAAPIDFTRDIRPIFEAHCLQCHGIDKQRGGFRLDDRDAALKGGENHAPAIRPNDSTNSPLIHFVSGQVEDMRMPPKGEPLSTNQIALLRAWIDQGAVWPSDQSKPKETHWSLQPLKRPTPPGDAPHPIDAFIQSKLKEKQLTPSPRADAHSLIRRLYFDLIGLPPTPEEVRRFERDNSPKAYASLVEKLLASPQHGERWARHWLDVVRFAETSGFEMNQPRPNAWPYRDYVIDAFNRDKPYDQFVHEQLAGDVLGEDAATGFLVGGPNDQVTSPDPVLTANQRADELHDMVSTTGSAFLGLTVGCARCHNHKFDPIPQRDYFAMKAVLEGVRHGDRPIQMRDAEARRAELAQSRGRLAEIDTQLAHWEPLAKPDNFNTNHLRAPVHARRNVERFTPATARLLRFTITKTTDAEPCIDELEVYTAEGKARNIALASNGTKARASSVYPNSEIHRLEHLNDGRYGNGRSWISNERGKGWVELEFPEPVKIERIVWGRDREQKYADRLATEYKIEIAITSNEWRVVASSADRRTYKKGAREEPVLDLATLTPAERQAAQKAMEQRKALEARIAELTRVPSVYAGTFEPTPKPTHRFHRGDPMQKREVIGAGALEAIPVTFKTSSAAAKAQPKLTEDQGRRLALAHWITDPANPLTARVMVNRLWQYHFGEGLVSTPSDFGVNGARPTHPELLDWLSAEFTSPTVTNHTAATPHGWSIKHIHRLIVTSATYQQASAARSDCLAVDASSSLLWRYPPHRLEAEAIRDAILATTGKLDLKMGGPGFSFFEPNDNYVRVYTPRQEFGPETFRRMIYGTVIRQRPDGVFGVFDCPDAGQIAPKRTRSTTPLQALNLLNSTFIMQQADFLADRLHREAGSDPSAQARCAFSLAFQRAPDDTELKAAKKLIEAQGLPIFCRALLNANEFVFIY